MRAEQGMHGKPLLAGFKPIKSGKCFSFNYFEKSHYGFDMYSAHARARRDDFFCTQYFFVKTRQSNCNFFQGK